MFKWYIDCLSMYFKKCSIYAYIYMYIYVYYIFIIHLCHTWNSQLAIGLDSQETSSSHNSTGMPTMATPTDPARGVYYNSCLARFKGWRRKYMGVSLNGGTPESSILIGFSILNHPFWGTTILGNPHINLLFGSWRGKYSIYSYHIFEWIKSRSLKYCALLVYTHIYIYLYKYIYIYMFLYIYTYLYLYVQLATDTWRDPAMDRPQREAIMVKTSWFSIDP